MLVSGKNLLLVHGVFKDKKYTVCKKQIVDRNSQKIKGAVFMDLDAKHLKW